MTDDEELAQVEHVISRLITRYPTVPRPDIECSVRTIHQRFNGCTIRDFVPLLVEKAAKNDIVARMQSIPVIVTGIRHLEETRAPAEQEFNAQYVSY